MIMVQNAHKNCVISMNTPYVKGTFERKNIWFLTTPAFKIGNLLPSARRCHFETIAS